MRDVQGETKVLHVVLRRQIVQGTLFNVSIFPLPKSNFSYHITLLQAGSHISLLGGKESETEVILVDFQFNYDCTQWSTAFPALQKRILLRLIETGNMQRGYALRFFNFLFFPYARATCWLVNADKRASVLECYFV